MRNFFAKKVALTQLEHNKVNGKSAERYFAALLGIALNGRILWSTRTEDDAKVDLVSILSHPWLVNRVEVLFTQVKSGESFCKVDGQKLIVSKEKFKSLLHRNHHTLVCWTIVDDGTPYWFLIRANSSFFRTEYGDSHILCPASRFDMIRILTSTVKKDGGNGLMFSRQNDRNEYDFPNFQQLRSQAKGIYNKLKQKEILSPLFGRIEFTRKGWRHITRESRLNAFKIASFEIMSILELLLKKTPSKHFNHTFAESNHQGYCYRESEFILEYHNVTCYDREKQKNIAVNVFVKIVELTGYSVAWRKNPNASNNVERRAIFKSIYYKEKSS